ncbi:MAG TPA: sensor histidine kinase [Bryobacteraceae bacterium]|jgi:signal transduction histidine kinase|nr:sensor histidine kinase [Bryobacteraceae bacterium]
MVKTQAQQSIWPVSVFGLGFMLIIMGLSGVASIQETRRIHQQILSVEDSYRHIENLVEGIRTDTSGADILRRDRLLDSSGAGDNYARQLKGLRSKTGADLERLRGLRPQQESRVFDRLETALRDYWDTATAEFQESPLKNKTASVRDQFASQSKKIFAVTEELGELNEENFEARRRELSRAVENLQNDIWETMLTALCLGAIIAGASVFRISGLEKESAEYQKASKQAEQRLRQLSQQLVSSQEQERKSLSRELHDEIGQLLTALRMELGNVERSHAASGGEADAHLDQAKKLAETTLKTTRDIAMGLRPAMLDLLGLGPALEWQTREYSRRYKTPIQLDVAGDLRDLPDPHRTYLYRIVQEGLTNCARHAQAKNIRVSLKDANGQLAVTVEDDGVGFDQHGGVSYGLGLLGITERVRELCGKISIQSEPGKGTKLEVMLPREIS